MTYNKNTAGKTAEAITAQNSSFNQSNINNISEMENKISIRTEICEANDRYNEVLSESEERKHTSVVNEVNVIDDPMRSEAFISYAAQKIAEDYIDAGASMQGYYMEGEMEYMDYIFSSYADAPFSKEFDYDSMPYDKIWDEAYKRWFNMSRITVDDLNVWLKDWCEAHPGTSYFADELDTFKTRVGVMCDTHDGTYLMAEYGLEICESADWFYFEEAITNDYANLSRENAIEL